MYQTPYAPGSSMATNYRLYLLDDFDWGYTKTNAEAQVLLCRSSIGDEFVTHVSYGLIVAECRMSPEAALLQLANSGVIWDSAYGQQLPDTGLLQYVKQDMHGYAVKKEQA